VIVVVSGGSALRLHRVVALALVLFSVTPAIAHAQTSSSDDTLLVRVEPGADVTEVVEGSGGVVVSTLTPLGYVVVRAEVSAAELQVELESDARVLEVVPNFVRHAAKRAHDPMLEGQRTIHASRFPMAWDTTTGSSDVDVAVLDTGVDLQHEDLDDRLAPGIDLVDGDTDPDDENGHGTKVAGVIAAESDNDQGIAGATWEGDIIPVRVLDSEGFGYDSTIAAGIIWAAEHGADVINMSLGAPGYSPVLEAAIRYAVTRNVVVVGASGNDGSREPFHPAAVDVPGMLAVGASDELGDAVWFSNYGSWLDIAAPGKDVVTTHPLGPSWPHYTGGYGTSYSAALVSGAAMLVRSRYPSLDAAAVTERLMRTAIDRGPAGRDDSYGRGLLDAYAAVGGPTAAPSRLPAADPAGVNDVADRAATLNTSEATVDTLSPEGDVDWFAVDVVEPGRINVAVRERVAHYNEYDSLLFDIVLDAYSPDHRLIERADRNPYGAPEFVRVSAPEPGRYLFRVTNDHASRGPSPYHVELEFDDSYDALFGDTERHDLGSAGRAVVVSDVTGDGLDDAVVTTSGLHSPETDNRLFVFPQLPTGDLGPPIVHSTHLHWSDAAGVDAGDLDGDGDDDVVVATGEGLDVFMQTGPGLIGPSLVGSAPSSSLDIADLDGDGRTEIVVIEDDALSVYRVVDDQWQRTQLDGEVGRGLEIGDVTSDGRVDIVRTWADTLRVLVQQPDGTFDVANVAANADLLDSEIVDVTGDDRPDVVAGQSYSADGDGLRVFEQTEQRTLAAPVPIGSSESAQALESADVDGDGRPDLVGLYSGGSIGAYLQRSPGDFSPAKWIGHANAYHHSDDALALADIDSDDDIDVVVADSDGDLVVVPQTGRDDDGGEGLWVRSASPRADATDVATSVSPTVTFGRTVEPGSVTTQTVMLRDGRTDEPVAGTVTFDSVANRASFDPSSTLAAGRSYVLSVDGVRSSFVEMPAEPFYTSFTTKAVAAKRDLASDVNGDGYDDVIVGAPREDVGSAADAGVVHVLFGSASGTKRSGAQVVGQHTIGVEGAPERGDRFGTSVATGDVNADGYDDVAIGVPGEDVGTVTDSGLVHVLLGSPTGVRTLGSKMWLRGASGVPGEESERGAFGAAVVFGSFDSVRGDDLAIGAPGAESVTVLRGASTGLAATGAEQWTLASEGIERGNRAGGSRFGAALASGDVNADGVDDLAVGAPLEDVPNVFALQPDAGTVTLLHGSGAGLRYADVFRKPVYDIPLDDGFYGMSLALVDVAGHSPTDGYADLVVGLPGWRGWLPDEATGDVAIYRSTQAGAIDQGLSWRPEEAQPRDIREAGDRAGWSVAAANVDGQGPSTIVAGIPFDDGASGVDAGETQVTGSSTEEDGVYAPSAPMVMTQDSPGVPDASETGDVWSAAVSVLDVDGDGKDDVVVGAPNEGIGGSPRAGSIVVFRGAGEATLITQGAGGAGGMVEAGDGFGSALAR
jgi:subtilisin family serine protease